MSITIDQENYEYVLSILGFPFIDPSTLNVPYDETTVKQYCIQPAMKEYFKWFPIKEEESVSVGSGGRGEKAYPDTYTYSVAYSAFTSQADSIATSQLGIGNPWITSRSYSTSSGMFGSRYDYGFSSTIGTTRNSDDIQRNANRVVRIVPNDNQRKVEYYSSEGGSIEIVWAKWSDNFTDVPWLHQKEVLELSQAELLLWLARVLQQTNPELPTEFNYEDMRTEGEDIKDRIMTKWKSYTKGVAMR